MNRDQTPGQNFQYDSATTSVQQRPHSTSYQSRMSYTPADIKSGEEKMAIEQTPYQRQQSNYMP